MADPTSNGPRNWLWPLLIALLAILLLIWFLNPSGNEDDTAVQDPIVTGDLSEPAPTTLAPGTALDTPATESTAEPAAAPAE